jgi:hypothetical protein
VRDRLGHEQTLYFGRASMPDGAASWYELPPAPPGQLFDARFSTGGMLQLLADTARSFGIRLQSESYPVSLSWDIVESGIQGIAINVGTTEAGRAGGSGGAPLRSERQGSIELASPPQGAIGVRLELASAAPKEFALRQNYPNPFNPTTSIVFDLPVEASVTLKVYDLVGREVAVLSENRKYPAGVHTLRLNAGGLGSGVYFYRLAASGSDRREFRQVKKLMVLR